MITRYNVLLSCFFLLVPALVFFGCASNENPVTPPDQQGDAYEQNRLLGRGINIGNALEAPNEGEWGVTLDAEYFQKIKSAGFNSVRIPIRWSTHALTNAPYTINPAFFTRIDWVIDQALSNNLAVVINIHHYEEIMQDPNGQKERFLAMWRQIADRYKSESFKLFFEVLNEPNANFTPSLWNLFSIEAVNVIRETNPNRTLIIGIADWGGPSALDQLVLPADDNVILTVHYYNPFEFTHQGAEWVTGAEAWLGTTWTGMHGELGALQSDFNRIIAWAASHNVPINCGEFGSYWRADMESRVRWTKAVADICAANDISFHYWEFCAGFGIYDRTTKTFNGLLGALLP